MASNSKKGLGLTQSNKNTHIFTEFEQMNKESTQQQVLEAIKNINLNVGEIVVGDITVESSDTITHTKLDTLNTTLTNKHLDKTLDSVDISGQTVAISNTGFDCSNIALTPLITGFALDSSVSTTNTKLDTLNTTITNKTLSKTTSSIDISGQSVSVSNMITGFATSALQTTSNNLLTDIKNKTIDSATDSITVFAGGENGLNIRYLSGAVDSVDVGLSTYAYSNRDPPFPATRDVLSNQLVAVDDLAGTNLINVLATAEGKLSVDITGQTIDVNTITGFATETTLGEIKTQTDKLVFNGDNLKTEVGNQITGFATETTLGGIKTQTDKLVFNGDNLKTEVGNQITGFATETTLGGIKTQTDKLVFNGDNLKTEVGNQITGFATETTLGGIKTQTDKLVFNGDNLKTEVGNMITGFATETTLGGIKSQTDKLVFNGDNLKTEVGNQITGFATETTLGAIKTQTDKLIFNGDNLKTVISNTSFDAKVRDANNLAITSTTYEIDPITHRGLDVNVINGTPANPLNVLVDTTAPLNTSVNNFPVSYEITAGAPLSSVASSLYTNLRDATGAAVGVAGNPLAVESNLITGFALESGGNLAGVKTNTDKFKFTGDDLKTTITNTLLVVETGTNPLDVNITGGTITGANGKAYLYSGDEATSITATTVGAKNGIDSNIINASIDVHNYASSNGTTWHHLSSDSNGQLNVHSKTQDGAGTDITSTLNGAKQSLDVNVSNNALVTLTNGTNTYTSVLNVESGRYQLSTSDFEATALLSGITDINADIRTNTSTLTSFASAGNLLLSTINEGVGNFTDVFVFGNFFSNQTITANNVTGTVNFTRGDLKRNSIFIYRDNATSVTDSVSFYTNSTSGTSTACLLATVFPIVVGGYRQVTFNVNLLPFNSLFIRNDSTTTSITGVYLTVTNG